MTISRPRNGPPGPANPPGAPNQRDLKDIYDRKARALTRRPELARSTGLARVRSVAGLLCTVDEGGHTRAVEMPGEGSPVDSTRENPSPAELLRASLASSLIMGYRLWAARLDVPVGPIEIDLRTEDDARGQLLLESEVGPGWQRIHLAVTVVSSAGEEAVRRVLELANRHCLVLATLSRDIERVFQLRVIAPSAAEGTAEGTSRSATHHASLNETASDHRSPLTKGKTS